MAWKNISTNELDWDWEASNDAGDAGKSWWMKSAISASGNADSH